MWSTRGLHVSMRAAAAAATLLLLASATLQQQDPRTPVLGVRVASAASVHGQDDDSAAKPTSDTNGAPQRLPSILPDSTSTTHIMDGDDDDDGDDGIGAVGSTHAAASTDARASIGTHVVDDPPARVHWAFTAIFCTIAALLIAALLFVLNRRMPRDGALAGQLGESAPATLPADWMAPVASQAAAARGRKQPTTGSTTTTVTLPGRRLGFLERWYVAWARVGAHNGFTMVLQLRFTKQHARPSRSRRAAAATAATGADSSDAAFAAACDTAEAQVRRALRAVAARFPFLRARVVTDDHVAAKERDDGATTSATTSTATAAAAAADAKQGSKAWGSDLRFVVPPPADAAATRVPVTVVVPPRGACGASRVRGSAEQEDFVEYQREGARMRPLWLRQRLIVSSPPPVQAPRDPSTAASSDGATGTAPVAPGTTFALGTDTPGDELGEADILTELLVSLADTPFNDSSHDRPLWRAALLMLPLPSHVTPDAGAGVDAALCLTFHHAVCDASASVQVCKAVEAELRRAAAGGDDDSGEGDGDGGGAAAGTRRGSAGGGGSGGDANNSGDEGTADAAGSADAHGLGPPLSDVADTRPTLVHALKPVMLDRVPALARRSDTTWLGPPHAPAARAEDRYTCYARVELSESDTSALVAACKEHGASITSVLGVACAFAAWTYKAWHGDPSSAIVQQQAAAAALGGSKAFIASLASNAVVTARQGDDEGATAEAVKAAADNSLSARRRARRAAARTTPSGDTTTTDAGDTAGAGASSDAVKTKAEDNADASPVPLSTAPTPKRVAASKYALDKAKIGVVLALAIDQRRRIRGAPAPAALGTWVTSVTHTLEVSGETQFWDAARKYRRDFSGDVNSSLQNVGLCPYIKEPWEEFAVKKALEEPNGRSETFSISNLGVVDGIGDDADDDGAGGSGGGGGGGGGGWRSTGLWFAQSHPRAGPLVDVSAVTARGRLRLAFAAGQPMVSDGLLCALAQAALEAILVAVEGAGTDVAHLCTARAVLRAGGKPRVASQMA